jgi:hypothetical protein
MMVTGNRQAGDIVTLFDGSTAIGTSTVQNTRIWTLDTSLPLDAGNHSLMATQTDGCNRTSQSSNLEQLTISLSSPSMVTFFGTSSLDVFTGGAGNDVFKFSAVDLSNSDTIEGGSGSDTLVMTTAAAVNAAGVSGVETYLLAGGAENSLTLIDGNFAGVTNNTITVLASGFDESTVTGSNKLIFYGGSGNDTILMGPVATVSGGGGNNQFTLSDIGTHFITDFGASAGNAFVFRDAGFDLGPWTRAKGLQPCNTWIARRSSPTRLAISRQQASGLHITPPKARCSTKPMAAAR